MYRSTMYGHVRCGYTSPLFSPLINVLCTTVRGFGVVWEVYRVQHSHDLWHDPRELQILESSLPFDFSPISTRFLTKFGRCRALSPGTVTRKGRDIEVAYSEQPRILEWVMSKPDRDTMGQFSLWARKLAGIVTDERPVGVDGDVAWTSTAEAIQILYLIDRCGVGIG